MDHPLKPKSTPDFPKTIIKEANSLINVNLPKHYSNYNTNNMLSNKNDNYNHKICEFWEKVGSCRHGNQCVRYHNKPKRSKTIIFRKIFNNPVRTLYQKSSSSSAAAKFDNENKPNLNNKQNGEFVTINTEINEEKLSKEADRLYQDLFVEFSLKYGELEDLIICGNFNTHIGGHVLVKFKDERSALKCYNDCNDRWYNEKPMFCELSPVKYLDDAICKKFSSRGICERGDQCNLIHVRQPNYQLRKMLQASQRAYYNNNDNT